MKTMIQALLALVGVGTAVLCWMDVTCWIDPHTSFPMVGSVWLRYGAILILYLMAAVASLVAVRGNARSKKPQYSMAVFSFLCGAACTATGVSRLIGAAPAIQQWSETMSQSGETGVPYAASLFIQICGGNVIMGIFALLCGWTLFVQSNFWRTMRPGEYPAGGLYFASSGLLYLCGLAFERFLAHTASIYRVYHILQLLSVMAALLFMLSLLRICFFPETDRAKDCVRNGLACFYVCSCCELIFSLVQWQKGQMATGVWLDSLALGMIGLLGLAAALNLVDPEQSGKSSDME